MAVGHHLGNPPAAVPKAAEDVKPPTHISDAVVQKPRILAAS
jgi:hypothetical protein